MKKYKFLKNLLIAFVFISTSVINGCGEKSPGPNPTPPNPCAGITITVSATVTNTTTGASVGAINASASGSTGFTFNLNGGAFQASGSFTGLPAGTYIITAKDANGCMGSNSFTVNDPCSAKNINVTSTTTGHDKCSITGTGSITVTATGSTGFTYQLNSGTFQASNIFTGLANNTYNITAKDVDGCTKTISVAVLLTPAGITFSAVKTLLQNNCATSGCHSGSAPAGGLNFTVDCTIVGAWDRIRARAVDSNPSQMPPPPAPPLSAADKQKILDWITAGRRFVD